MKRKWIIAAACAVLLSGMEAMACTGLLVGKKASVDGSVMISYAADSHTLYGELYRWPAATWPKGAMLEVREWDTNKPLGQIPQVEQTYSVVGNMNEHQVAITESTFGGRPELVDTTGIMDATAKVCDRISSIEFKAPVTFISFFKATSYSLVSSDCCAETGKTKLNNATTHIAT